VTTTQDQEVTGRLIASRYRLRDVIGKGGMGSVWLADDTLLHRQVAVKELRFPASVTDEERAILRKRSLREARSAARLDTPHVVRIYDVVDEGGNPCIVMELLRGRTLAQIVRSDGPLPPAVVAQVGQALAAALRVAHAAGVVHRDVKPGNVFLSQAGRVVLTDFGIATSAGDPSITDTGLLVGSPAFMAPERARGGEPTPASDLWSLGATLYTAVEGKPPFDAGDPVGTLTAVVSDAPRPMRRAGELAGVLAALLTKDPAGRPSVDQAARELAAVAAAAGPVDNAAWAAAIGAEPAHDDPYPAEPSYGSDVERTTVLRLAAAAASAPAVTEEAAEAAEAADDEPAAERPAGVDAAEAAAVVGGGEVAEEAVSAPTGARLPAVGARPAPAARPRLAPAGPAHPIAPTEVARDETIYADAEPDRRRTLVALLAVAVVVVAAVAVGLTQLAGGGSPSAAGPSAAASHPVSSHTSAAPVPSVSAPTGSNGSGSGASSGPSAGSSSGTSPSSSSGTSGSGTSASGTPGAAPVQSGGAVSVGAAVPAGWQAYRSLDGWQVAYPAGWSVNRHVVRGETVTDFQSGTGELIRIEITPTPYDRPIDDWVNYEPQFAARVSGYQRIALRSLTVGGYPAADWEFLYTDGVQLHAIDREIRVGGTTYAILFQTHADGWDAAAHDRQAALGSFRAG
jgi:eukaryotic-like serine/threonine-protein kinase